MQKTVTTANKYFVLKGHLTLFFGTNSSIFKSTEVRHAWGLSHVQPPARCLRGPPQTVLPSKQ